MRRIVLAAAATAALAGCRDPQAARLQRVKDAVCACKTASCAQAALEGVPQGKIRTDHHEQEIARDMLDCLARVYDAGRPTSDPDAPAPDGP